LLLGRARHAAGDRNGALRAWYQAVMRAQRAGLWIDAGTTPPQLLQDVLLAIAQLRDGQRELLFASYDELRQREGNAAVQRVDRAVEVYLREVEARPADPRQRPRFFYFPGLPEGPYHNPSLQPWAQSLREAYPAIRGEALARAGENASLSDYLDIKSGDSIEQYLRGADVHPAWEAFFFYRRGRRFDENHARCPLTSHVLESIELCRIADHAPEICYSVLRPGTHILPHFGVTNTRVVLHLPLLVPENCALHVIGNEPHAWKEGELVMFDDTYEHEAWNRSAATRIVLLMDCWNPYLTTVEKQALSQLIETIGGLNAASRQVGK
jgi:aspartate beta-hydroxylase